MVKTPYVLAKITATGLPPIYCDGGEIDDQMKSSNEFHGGSHDRLSETLGERTVTWKLTNPMDHLSLNLLAYQCRAGFTFTISWFGEDTSGVFRQLERTDGCSVVDRKRDFGSFKAVQLTCNGTADNTEPLLASYV
jgi:hypothetical protein